MAKKNWIVIDDCVPDTPVDPDKAKAWLNDTFYGREGLIDLEVRQLPWHPDDLMAKLNVDPFNNALVDHLVAGNQFYPPKPEEPEPDEPTVPLEQIVAEYAEAVGEATGHKPADVARRLKALEPIWNGKTGTFEAPSPPRHHRSVKNRKVQSRQDKQASRTARRRERKARKAGR